MALAYMAIESTEVTGLINQLNSWSQNGWETISVMPRQEKSGYVAILRRNIVRVGARTMLSNSAG